MMAGALFYAARIPVEHAEQGAPAANTSGTAASPAGYEAVYPTFELPDIDGNPRNLSEWAGKHTLLNFWATWCAPCRREIPLLKAFQDEHGPNGFQVIGIAVDFAEEVAAYAEQAEFNYPIVIGQEEAMAVAETSGIDFIGMPFTMIVAADGELINAHIGEILAEDLEHIVDVIRKLESGEYDKLAARAALSSL